MKTFTVNEKRSAPAIRKMRQYVHHPMGPAQQTHQVAMRNILRPDEAQTKPAISNRPADDPSHAAAIQRSDKKEPEKEPSQTKLIQRQPDHEEEEPVQTQLMQRKVTDLSGIRPSRFGYAGPEAKAQQSKIRRILHSTGAQAKLIIGQPNDPFEQEADRIADQVMAMPDSKLQRQPENEEEEEPLQAKPLADQITSLVQRQEEPSEEEEEVQAKENGRSVSSVSTSVERGLHTLRSGGSVLPESTRSFFEPRFGRDFSGVRIHTNSTASYLARSVNSRAFTVGQDVVFGAGQYSPGTSSGRRLLGHELTHVIQQTNRVPSAHTIQREALYIRSLRPGASSSTGHAFVTMENAQNLRESWGFYAHCASGPLGSRGCSDGELLQMGVNFALPGHVKREVGSSFDDSIRHSLTSTDYTSANARIRALRLSPPDYRLWSYNCVDFVRTIAGTVGISIPNFPGIDEPDELSAYIRGELDTRLLRSGTLRLDRIGSGGSVVDISNSVTGSANAPHFQINSLPTQHNLRFRWIISDSQNRSYLMWGDTGQVFQYGRQFNAYIGSGTRALLRSRNIRGATVKCRVRAGGSTLLLTLPVTFTW